MAGWSRRAATGRKEVKMIREGDEAPAIEATIQDGSRVTLADWLERGPLVLYFYPKDFTPG